MDILDTIECNLALGIGGAAFLWVLLNWLAYQYIKEDRNADQ